MEKGPKSGSALWVFFFVAKYENKSSYYSLARKHYRKLVFKIMFEANKMQRPPKDMSK